jgi:osmotically-inducible protein OsmY
MKTDLKLQRDVIDELAWEPAINAARIGVEAKDGIVTLTGLVDSHGEKWMAERAAQRVSGVRALAIELSVELPGPSQRTDADIAEAATDALLWTTSITASAVNILVEDGWITLTGNVDWEYERQAASRALRYLRGVRGVSNQLAVEPKISLDDVRTDIETALQRRGDSMSKDIGVKISGSEVTLSGEVRNWADRDLAMHAAWSAPGVRHVMNNILVTD